MGKWQKSSPELVARFQAALPDDPGVERRSMFGYPAAFVGGNMFAGLHEERCLVRLDEAPRATLLAEPGAVTFAPMPVRPMREYVVVPLDLVGDPKELAAWLGKAFAYARRLPPKAKRPVARAPKIPKPATARPAKRMATAAKKKPRRR